MGKMENGRYAGKAQHMTREGTILDGKYELLKQIGQGGMSVVYLAMDVRLNKQWAVKEIKKGNKQDTEILLRSLKTEAEVLKKVDHPVLPRIVDIIHCDNTIFVVMDYIEGRTLEEVLKSEGAQPQRQVIDWAKDLCSALNYLHSMDPPVIYRDMKPSNIMLKPDGRVKLIDFGTAKVMDRESTADTVALGTRGYAAPEQFGDVQGRGIHKTDARTDIYSLGISLYYVLTGNPPGEPPYAVKSIREWNPMLSGGLDKIIKKCTMPAPEDRYQNCMELMYALDHYEELDDAFRRSCFKKMKSFLLFAGLTVISAVTALGGYIGSERERRQDYEYLMNDAYAHTVRGEYEQAANIYAKAITEIDGSRNTAYLELMRLYINYIGDAEEGLNRVTYYIDQGYKHIDRDQQLLFRVAIGYFDVLKDYKSSAYYFNLVDVREYPEAAYYSAIALAMGELDTDYSSLSDNLLQFEKLNDNMTISAGRLMNYKLLCIIYARIMQQMDGAAKKLIQAADKGIRALEEYDDDSIKAEYYTVYHQYLALAYEQLGKLQKGQDEETAEKYYKKALECCDFVLGMTSVGEGRTLDRITDLALREAKYCQKAEIYEAMGEYEEACKVYEKAEREYGKNSISLYIGHLKLLCNMQEKKTTDVELWDFDVLYGLYAEAEEVPDIERDYRWRQLTQRLAPLLERREAE
ncbi:MAG: serine/threonine-protein kinase [Lachnospiraceae bacterium]|nr:serine/threonine-protein kinase [Lachnospiraceae bacterium]